MTALLLVLASLSSGALYQDHFAEAGQAYNDGQYGEAVRLYEALVAEQVEEPALFYNLGNAYYRIGRMGPAIANYERALALEPAFEQAQDNLREAVRHTERRLERPLPPDWEQSLLFWHYNIPTRLTRWLAVLSWVAFWSVMALRQWRQIRGTGWAAIVLLVIGVAFGGSAWAKAHPTVYAVASQNRVPVHYGTSDDATLHFELYDGDRVSVDDRTNGWSRVTTADGQRGWTRDENLAFVTPPYTQAPALLEDDAHTPKPEA